jgi:hypothetical protein
MKEGKYMNIRKKSKTCFVMHSQAWEEMGYKHLRDRRENCYREKMKKKIEVNEQRK